MWCLHSRRDYLQREKSRGKGERRAMLSYAGGGGILLPFQKRVLNSEDLDNYNYEIRLNERDRDALFERQTFLSCERVATALHSNQCFWCFKH
jgi:hypothetical protein